MATKIKIDGIDKIIIKSLVNDARTSIRESVGLDNDNITSGPYANLSNLRRANESTDEQTQEANEIKIQVTRFNFTGNTALSNEQLTNLTKDFIGKELSYNELRDVLRLISNFYIIL